ncbi:MAG TPA: tripartite tricarboxylate transporter substrate-binding protein [Xanthobacteraceae bacterium]|nr:tripartite tricarboxylate transporter substrate-binding protein [Xanthobacteraceae bacterium]
MRDALLTRRAFMISAAAVGGAAFGRIAQAATYPDRPVRVVLPLGPGGVGDISARIVADRLSDRLGQRFFIENQPSPDGIVAAHTVLNAPADGYSLLLMTGGIASSVPQYNEFPYDLGALVPISSIGYFDCLMVVNAKSSFHNLGDFLGSARAKPGALNVGTISAGGVQHLTANYFKQASGANFVIVPFRTTPDTIVALMRDDVQMVIDFYAALKSGIDSGELRAIAWAGAKPSPAMPNVPTAADQGVKDFHAASWNSFYAKKGTPQEVVDTLNKALYEVLAEPEVKQKLLALGIDSRASTPAEMDAQMQADIKKWAEVIERAGLEKK